MNTGHTLTHRPGRRIRRTAAVVVVALAAAVLAAGAQSAPASDGYVPFVTDFPSAPARGQTYVPFVTDFPKPAPLRVAQPASPGIDAGRSGTEWAALGLGAAFLVLLVGSAVAVAGRPRPLGS